MSISEFIALVRQEEAKYTEEEQNDTKTMITRFRKLFYDSDGWDKILIPDAVLTKVIKPYITLSSENSHRRFYNYAYDFDLIDMGYYPTFPITKERPTINSDTNSSPQTQEVRLEIGSDNGMLLDIGHLFAGLDAYYHPSSVRVGTFDITENIDAVTWVGDLGSAVAEIYLGQKDRWGDFPKVNSIEDAQELINHYASGPDMLGNMDAYIISRNYLEPEKHFQIPTDLRKVSDILEHYYLGDGVTLLQNKRYTIFAEEIGLNWDNNAHTFSNFYERLYDYLDQVNDAGALYIAISAKNSSTGNAVRAGGIILAVSLNTGITWDITACFFEQLENGVEAEKNE